MLIFNKKTLESILRTKYIYQIWNMTSRRQKHRFYHFCYGNVCLHIFLKTFYLYAMPIPIQTKVHFKNLQFLAMTYDMGFLSLAFDVV